MEVIGDIWNLLIIKPMINSLVLLYYVLFNSFALSIIAFTLLVRAAMVPLTIKQSRQIRAMSALQPKLKEIQERHSKDRQKATSETMKTYREHGVNPLGCLGPMFIQFPIWIGLYQALLQTLPSTPESLVGLSRHLYPWLPWVHGVVPLNSIFFSLDLARPDPTPVLPILVGVSMFLLQKMTSMPTADPRQQSTNRMMLWMMPLMFGFFTTAFPSGLALYWVISNIVGIVIQGFVTGWEPLLSLRSFRPFGRSTQEPATAPALVPSAEETVKDEPAEDRDDGKDGGRGDRNRPTRARRRSRRSRNRRR